MDTVLEAYSFPETLLGVARYGQGHINDTYCVVCQPQEGGRIRFILQGLSTAAFPMPEELMENMVGITSYLREKIIENGGDVSYDPPPLRWIFKRFIFSPFDRAQSDLLPTAPSIFSTPLLWVRYRILAGSEERCRWFFYNSLPKQKIIEKSRKISILYKAFTAFAYSIRAPPSEV